MSVSEKDLKILWGKAAGRCAITKKKLVAEASKEIPAQNIVLGEACHIVAESEAGPRGKSVLTSEERNSYPNLILLCREEHVRIDKDHPAWPIEKLHHLKAQHELWVEQQLAEGVDHEGQIYANLVNTITDALELNRWDRVCDNAIRGLSRNGSPRESIPLCLRYSAPIGQADILRLKQRSKSWQTAPKFTLNFSFRKATLTGTTACAVASGITTFPKTRWISAWRL